MGGAEAVLASARRSFDEGDFRWVAEVVNHVVFAEPANAEARELQARALEQLAYGAENATWRNVYLMGARELREGPLLSPAAFPLDMLSRLTVSQILDTVAVRIDGPRAWDVELRINFSVGADQRFLVRVQHGVLSHVMGRHDPDADATITLPEGQLVPLLLGMVSLADLVADASADVEGDVGVIDTVRGLIDPGDPGFAIVTP